MGNYLSKNKINILMLGLDSAGKTTIIYQLRSNNKVVNTTPTIGFNVETLIYKNLQFTCFDVGGSDKALWHYYKDIDALIFVIDSNDRERLDDAIYHLNIAINDLAEYNNSNFPLLILANKQDLTSACSPEEISGKTKLCDKIGINRKWLIQGSSAVTKHGLNEGLEWLVSNFTQ